MKVESENEIPPFAFFVYVELSPRKRFEIRTGQQTESRENRSSRLSYTSERGEAIRARLRFDCEGELQFVRRVCVVCSDDDAERRRVSRRRDEMERESRD